MSTRIDPFSTPKEVQLCYGMFLVELSFSDYGSVNISKSYASKFYLYQHSFVNITFPQKKLDNDNSARAHAERIP